MTANCQNCGAAGEDGRCSYCKTPSLREIVRPSEPSGLNALFGCAYLRPELVCTIDFGPPDSLPVRAKNAVVTFLLDWLLPPVLFGLAVAVLSVSLAGCGGKPEGRTFPHQCFTSECTKEAPPCTADNDLAPECKAK